MSFGETLVQYIGMETIVRKEGDCPGEGSVFGKLTMDNSGIYLGHRKITEAEITSLAGIKIGSGERTRMALDIELDSSTDFFEEGVLN